MVYNNNEVAGRNLEEIGRSTADDHVLSELGEKIQNSWPSRRDDVNNKLKYGHGIINHYCCYIQK